MTDNNKFDPMKEISNLRNTVGKVIEQGIQSVQNINSQGLQVRVDVYEVGDELIIRTAPLDGLVGNSLEISIEGGVLTLSGVTQEEETPANASFYVQERRFGAFTKSIELNIPVVATEAKAKVKHGTITITLPIDRERLTHIEINDGE